MDHHHQLVLVITHNSLKRTIWKLTQRAFLFNHVPSSIEKSPPKLIIELKAILNLPCRDLTWSRKKQLNLVPNWAQPGLYTHPTCQRKSPSHSSESLPVSGKGHALWLPIHSNQLHNSKLKMEFLGGNSIIFGTSILMHLFIFTCQCSDPEHMKQWTCYKLGFTSLNSHLPMEHHTSEVLGFSGDQTGRKSLFLIWKLFFDSSDQLPNLKQIKVIQGSMLAWH